MNKTIFIAALLAVATVLAAGLTVLPGSVQEAQANPCSIIAQQNGDDNDFSDVEEENELDCEWENGNLEIIEFGIE